MISSPVPRAAPVEPATVPAALIVVLSSNSGRPDIPIIDPIPEHDELAMAGYCRGFWSRDSISPVRWLDATATDRDLVLTNPAPTSRSANGGVPSRSVGEGGGRVADVGLGVIEVVDAFEPAVLRRFALAEILVDDVRVAMGDWMGSLRKSA